LQDITKIKNVNNFFVKSIKNAQNDAKRACFIIFNVVIGFLPMAPLEAVGC